MLLYALKIDSKELGSIGVGIQAIAMHETIEPSTMVYFSVEELIHSLALLQAIRREFTRVLFIDVHVDHFAFFGMATFKAAGELISVPVPQNALTLDFALLELSLVSVAVAELHLGVISKLLRFLIKLTMVLIAVGKLQYTVVLLPSLHLAHEVRMRNVICERARSLHLVCFPDAFVVIILIATVSLDSYLPGAALFVLREVAYVSLRFGSQ